MKINLNDKFLGNPTALTHLAVSATFITLATTLGIQPAHATSLTPIAVDLELSLLLDTSGSVSTSEFALQRDGYVKAFNDISLWNTISQGKFGRIAVNYIYWSSSFQQQQAVGWTLIDSFAAAQTFASLVAATTRPFSGLTAPGSAINYATPLFGTETGGIDNGFHSTRQVIDVSGDGSQNNGANTAAARDVALAAGVDAINGLPILGSEPNLDIWYQNNIQGGVNSFVLPAASFADFDIAIKQKLIKEIAPPEPPSKVPEPSAIAGLLWLGGVVFGMKRKATAKSAPV